MAAPSAAIISDPQPSDLLSLSRIMGCQLRAQALEIRVTVQRAERRIIADVSDVGDGIGIFQKSTLPSRAADPVHKVCAPAFLICGHPYFALPLEPCPCSHGQPDPALVDLVRTAAEYRDYVFANRSREIVDLAHDKGMGATRFARLLRLNYLAPDIQAAIIDGTQPPGLRPWDILHGPMPLDWEQQRQLMGFP